MVLRLKAGRPYRLDAQGIPIPGGTIISDVLEVALTSTTWVPVTLQTDNEGYGMACKSIFAGLRVSGAWRLSHLAAGTRYITLPGGLALNIAGVSGQTLFYAQSVAVTATLEVMLLD